ncbi:hypothetical protein B296_00006320 [Ensete ventricosum]|uniref:DhaL domain-containing protein n=1 Tax=Ensete ventricosum TaxID=4639 RepID=A0A427AFW9_ENSVE|nr:hypothetical protein B296_00006320 [Ensete ventricosum]
MMEVAIEAAANEIINLKEKLNEWDSKVGDGDCGSTMHRGATAVLEDMKRWYGNLLVSYSFHASWATALEASVAAVSKYGGAVAGYRTMLDALIPASKVLREASKGILLISMFVYLPHVGHELLVTRVCFFMYSCVLLTYMTRCTNMQAGRSTYIAADLLSSVPDPGAMAAAAWYRAAALAVENKLCPSETKQI